MLGTSVQEAMVERQLTKCTWAGSLGLKVAAPKGNAHLSRLYCPCALSSEQAEWQHTQELILAVFWQCPEPGGSRPEERRTILTAACTR